MKSVYYFRFVVVCRFLWLLARWINEEQTLVHVFLKARVQSGPSAAYYQLLDFLLGQSRVKWIECIIPAWQLLPGTFLGCSSTWSGGPRRATRIDSTNLFRSKAISFLMQSSAISGCATALKVQYLRRKLSNKSQSRTRLRSSQPTGGGSLQFCNK